jgi:hypothetical protein
LHAESIITMIELMALKAWLSDPLPTPSNL